MAYYTFVNGNVLTASQLLVNLMDQAVVKCTNSTVRDALPWTKVAGSTVYKQDTFELQQYTTGTTGWRPPWNMPWGVMGAARITSNQSTYVLVDTPGLSVGPVTYVANRRLKITAHGQILSSLAEGCVVTIDDGSGQIHGGNVYSPTNNWASYWTSIHYVADTTAGANTYKVRHGPSYGSSGQILMVAAATSPCILIVEDIGPAANPA